MSIPTASDAAGPSAVRRARRRRRVGLAALFVLVVAATGGWLGPRTHEATITLSSGARATVEATSITRPGLDTEMLITLPEAGQRAVITVDRALLADLGIEMITPQPESEAADGDAVRFTFALAGAKPFEVGWSGRTPTAAVPQRHTYRLAIAIDDGPAAQHVFHTWVLP